jgi:hypothetical protein
MRYYWMIIVIPLILIVIIGIYQSFFLNFLASTDPFPDRLLLVILNIITAIGSSFVLVIHFLEQKKIPILEFKLFTTTEYSEIIFYYIRIENKAKEGMAEKCEGWITIDGRTSQTIWANESVSCNIPFDVPMDLRLFGIKNEEINISPISKKVNSRQLLIPTLLPEYLRKSTPVVYDPKPYDYKEKEITISLGAIRGRTPKPLTVEISEIIDKAIIE